MSSSDLDEFGDNFASDLDLSDVVVAQPDDETTGLLSSHNGVSYVPTGSYDAISPSRLQADPNDADTPKTKKKKIKEKDKIKSGQKIVADALKTDMAAERTFFKWLWTGLHTGAIGTFIFVTFDNDKRDPYRVAVVAFAWVVAFSLVLYGLYAYNRRRKALREGRIEVIPHATREFGPCIVVIAIGTVVASGLLYAVFSGNPPHNKHSMTPL
jgi:uncharacterized membrane protein YidH (DUF202 family)